MNSARGPKRRSRESDFPPRRDKPRFRLAAGRRKGLPPAGTESRQDAPSRQAQAQSFRKSLFLFTWQIRTAKGPETFPAPFPVPDSGIRLFHDNLPRLHAPPLRRKPRPAAPDGCGNAPRQHQGNASLVGELSPTHALRDPGGVGTPRPTFPPFPLSRRHAEPEQRPDLPGPFSCARPGVLKPAPGGAPPLPH